MSNRRTVNLGDEIDLLMGFPFESKRYSTKTDDVKLLRGDNIAQGNLRWDDVKRWPKTEIENYQSYQLQADDVVLAMDRPWIYAGLKFSAISKSDLPCLQVQRTARMRGGSNLDNRYLKYVIGSPWFSKYIQKITTGSLVPHISSRQIKEFSFHLPPLTEQQKIAGVLSAIDTKIELNNRINAELEAMAKTLYDYWFVQFDFPDANGKPYKTSGGKMVYNAELKRDVPEGWSDGTLEDLGQIVGGSTPTTTETDNFCKEGFPWITPNDLSGNQGKKFITRGGIDVSEIGIKSASLKKYPKGTVLLSSRAPVGYMAIARNELTTNQGFKSFIPNKGYSSAFIFYTVRLSLKVIIQYASGSTFKEVSGGVLKTVKILLPPEHLSKKYTESVSAIFARQDNLEQENKKLEAIRDWLLPMLMNGQVTVKNSGI